MFKPEKAYILEVNGQVDSVHESFVKAFKHRQELGEDDVIIYSKIWDCPWELQDLYIDRIEGSLE